MQSKHNNINTNTSSSSSSKPKRTFQGVLGSRPVSGDKKAHLGDMGGAATASSPLLSRSGSSNMAARKKQVSSPITPSSTLSTTPSGVVVSTAADRRQSVSFAADAAVIEGPGQRGIRGGVSATAASLATSTRSNTLTSLGGAGYSSSRTPLQEASVHLLGQQLRATYTQMDRAVGLVQHESTNMLIASSRPSSLSKDMNHSLQEDCSSGASSSVLKASISSPTTSNITPSTTIGGVSLTHQTSAATAGLSIKDDAAWMEEVVEVVAQLMRSTKTLQSNRQRVGLETLFPRGLQLQYIFSGGKNKMEL